MIDSAFSVVFANISLEAILKFVSSPKNSAFYNGCILLLLAVVGAALSWACVRLTQVLTTKNVANPRKLFLQLCRAHQLSVGERRQLEQLATLVGTSTPAILMVDASLWKLDELVREQKLASKQRERLLTLQKTLYDQPRLTFGGLPNSLQK